MENVLVESTFNFRKSKMTEFSPLTIQSLVAVFI